MLAGTNDFLLLLVAAIVVVGGLIVGYLLTKPKPSTKPSNTQQKPETVAERASAVVPTDISTIEAISPPPQPEEAPHSTTVALREPEPADEVEDSPAIELNAHLRNLDTQIKHRIIYRFMPHLKGMLFEGETLDGYLADAAARAAQRGWSDAQLVSAAESGKWKKPRSSDALPSSH